MKVNRFTKRLVTGLASVALLLTGLVATAAPASAETSTTIGGIECHVFSGATLSPAWALTFFNTDPDPVTKQFEYGANPADPPLTTSFVVEPGAHGEVTYYIDASQWPVGTSVYLTEIGFPAAVVTVPDCTPEPPVAGDFTFEMATPTCTDGAAYQVITTISQDPVTRSVVVVYPDTDDRNFIIAQGETHPFTYLIPQGVAYSVQVLVDNVTLYDQAQPAFSCAQPPVRTSGPTVVGPVFRVGKVIKCVATYTSTSGAVTPTYAWKRGTTTVAGATKSSYVLSYLDLGKRMTCGSGASNPVGSVPMAYSAASAVVALGLAPHIVSATYNPRVVGTVKRGYTVKAYVGRWTAPVPTGYAYQWYKDGKAIKGATKSSFKIPSSYRYHKLSVRITAIKAGYARGYKFSAAYKVK